ncbi:hypothetical protein MDA_GLEAN10017355 [Myotis davidii]|uniref:Uncharacterized protein n=1 Tax=Myotis davidii TaxID=225400 RepID=L5LHQ2_MYODS|nr:hypothetical protein MDA_GLEAN10017355 [Myotis davidii]
MVSPCSAWVTSYSSGDLPEAQPELGAEGPRDTAPAGASASGERDGVTTVVVDAAPGGSRGPRAAGETGCPVPLPQPGPLHLCGFVSGGGSTRPSLTLVRPSSSTHSQRALGLGQPRGSWRAVPENLPAEGLKGRGDVSAAYARSRKTRGNELTSEVKRDSEREEGEERKKERESELETSMREKHRSAASCTPPTGGVLITKVHALDWNRT